MAKVGDIFGSNGVDFENAKRMSELDNGEIFKIKKYNVFYSEKYEAAGLAVETDEGEILTTFSEPIVDRVIKAKNMGLRLRGAILQYKSKVSKQGNTYMVLEQPEPEDYQKYLDGKRVAKSVIDE